jgi:hypothetical protein
MATDSLRAFHTSEHSLRTSEVIGQCQECLDMFSIVIFRHKGELHIQETASVRMAPDGPKHRCGGKVKLYGNERY